VIVAAIMSALALQGAAIVFRQASAELRRDERRLPVAGRSMSSS
jgi:hypothetical protein